jgi:hypothetical protein
MNTILFDLDVLEPAKVRKFTANKQKQENL